MKGTFQGPLLALTCQSTDRARHAIVTSVTLNLFNGLYRLIDYIT